MPLYFNRRKSWGELGDDLQQHDQHLYTRRTLYWVKTKLAIQRQNRRVHSNSGTTASKVRPKTRDRKCYFQYGASTDGLSICPHIKFQLCIDLLLIGLGFDRGCESWEFIWEGNWRKTRKTFSNFPRWWRQVHCADAVWERHQSYSSGLAFWFILSYLIE